MSADATDPDRDEDLAELLDDLEATLADLQSELRGEAGPKRRRDPSTRPARRDRDRTGSDFPRPPSVSDLLGFTEQYTIPTLISTLEATIRALELLRGTLRLVNPDRSALETSTGRRDASSMSRLGSGAAGVGREAISGVERALSELERSLADSDVAGDRASEELLGEVRDLSREIRQRLETAQEPRTADRTDRRWNAGGSGRRRAGTQEPEGTDRRKSTGADPGSDGVAIEVTDGDAAGEPDDEGDSARGGRPEVDVEAELESIRHEIRGAEGADPGAGSTSGGADGGGSDGDAGRAADREGGSAGDGEDSPADDAENSPADDAGDGSDAAGAGDDRPA